MHRIAFVLHMRTSPLQLLMEIGTHGNETRMRVIAISDLVMNLVLVNGILLEVLRCARQRGIHTTECDGTPQCTCFSFQLHHGAMEAFTRTHTSMPFLETRIPLRAFLCDYRTFCPIVPVCLVVLVLGFWFCCLQNVLFMEQARTLKEVHAYRVSKKHALVFRCLAAKAVASMHDMASSIRTSNQQISSLLTALTR